MELKRFLQTAVALELAAEETYLALTEAMARHSNRDAAEFFREMAGYCALHRETAMERAGITSIDGIQRDLAEAVSAAREAPAPGDVGNVDLEQAMSLALLAEQNGLNFYLRVAESTEDAQLRAIASDFVDEERGHIHALERFLGHRPY